MALSFLPKVIHTPRVALSVLLVVFPLFPPHERAGLAEQLSALYPNPEDRRVKLSIGTERKPCTNDSDSRLKFGISRMPVDAKVRGY